jgi:hypothetical protein
METIPAPSIMAPLEPMPSIDAHLRRAASGIPYGPLTSQPPEDMADAAADPAAVDVPGPAGDGSAAGE